MNALLAAAREYLRLGLHPIPCVPRSKRPLVPWREFQEQAPHPDQIEVWWHDWPDANVALVLGRGTFAVDLDGGDDAQDLLVQRGVLLPGAPRSKTANGYHVFLAAPGPIPDRVGLLTTRGTKPQVDIRGVGYVVAPPSIHPAGPVYEWQVPFTLPLPPAPPELLRLIERGALPPPPPGSSTGSPGGVGASWVLEALRGVGIGTRDQTCTRLAGVLLGHGLDVTLTEAILCATFAAACQPPFPAEDVRKCVRSIDRRRALEQARDRPGLEPESIATVLMHLEQVGLLGGPPTLRTPFPTLNQWLNGGFSPGELIFLGARPGVGKTALGLRLARDTALDGQPVLVVSREMRTLALGRRLLAQTAAVSASAVKRWAFDLAERTRIDQALTRLRGLPLWLTDQVGSIGELHAMVTAADPPYQLVVVDYLQLVAAPPDIRERRLQVEAVSQSLKALAMTGALTLLCLSSLSRPPRDAGADRLPTLADLRESGELEHDADVVLFLHRPMLDTQAKLIVAKQRDGAVGILDLTFTPETLTFAEAV